ncbi:hypothetical protein [Flavobacterium rhizosphaerae]|uniref:DUF5050 domain-containing protein n=1 Tax=Flavobacterium rhizosphaerae TaxID=3163298 RepID=A0ABW8YVI4_9FLAO
MKTIICSVMAFFAIVTSFAQGLNFKSQTSEVFTDDYYRSNIAYIEDLGEKGVIMARTLSNDSYDPYDFEAYSFEHYDRNMKLVNSYFYETGKAEGNLLGMYIKNNKIYFVDLREAPDKKTYICAAFTAGIDDFKFTSTELFNVNASYIDTATHLMSAAGLDEDKTGSMAVNADKNAFAIALKLVKNKQEQHDIYVYDGTTLHLKFKQEYKNTLKDKDFTFDNLAVSLDGEAVYYISLSKNVKKKSKWDYQSELTSVTKDGIKSNILGSDKELPFFVKVVPKKDKIACIGLYVTDKPTDPKGFCYFAADPKTMEIETTVYNPFSQQFMTDRYGKKKAQKIGPVKFRSVYITDNNDIVFNAEEYNISSELNVQRNSAKPNMYYYMYSYDDIITGKIDDSGNLLWSRNINKSEELPKDQPYLYSYASVIKGDKTYYFVNASTNLDRLDDTRVSFEKNKQKHSSFYIICIDANGNMEYKPVLDYDKGDMFYKASYGHVAQQTGEIYFLGYSQGKRQLLKVTLE